MAVSLTVDSLGCFMGALQAISLDFSLAGIEAATQCEGESVSGRFKQFQLRSHYQPIFSLSHRRAVGYEALVRPVNANGAPLSPLTLFDAAQDDTDLIFLDRLCRNIHVRNFLNARDPDTWLFLNINPRVVVHAGLHPPFFKVMLDRYEIPPGRIVVEILENEIADENQLAETVRYYASLGCLVAIDDFGAGYSNFDRIWRLGPDLVKLDRTMLVQARTQSRVRRVLPTLVSLLHETGCITLIEGVETEEEALIATDSGIDLVQGYFFGRPAAASHSCADEAAQLPDLCTRFRNRYSDTRAREDNELKPYITEFRNCASLLSLDSPLREASLALLNRPRALRCYLIDAEGGQVGPNVLSEQTARRSDARFKPLANVSNASWSRRPYFRPAVAHPGRIQNSRPYLSIPDAQMCITLSVTVDIDGARLVYCADLQWQDLDALTPTTP